MHMMIDQSIYIAGLLTSCMSILRDMRVFPVHGIVYQLKGLHLDKKDRYSCV